MTLALSGGTSGAVLGGTVTGTAVNGVATFTGLTINTAGTGYTLTASSSPLTSATSSITVTAATAAPSITGLSRHRNGPAAGGTTVTINGTNFTGATAVQFGAVNATSYTVDSTGTVITAVSPAGSPGYVHITVTTPAGTSPQSPSGLDTFEYARRDHRGAECNEHRLPRQRPRRGRHHGDDQRNQLHRRHGGAVWYRERHELHRRLDWHCDHCRQPSR